MNARQVVQTLENAQISSEEQEKNIQTTVSRYARDLEFAQGIVDIALENKNLSALAKRIATASAISIYVSDNVRNLYRKGVVELAKKGDFLASETIYHHSGIKEFAEYIVELAKRGDASAREEILQNFSSSLFTEYVVELAGQGNASAREAIFQNSDDGLFAEYIVELAKQGDVSAREKVLQDFDNIIFAEYIVELAKQGNAHARGMVLQNFGNNMFAEYIVELAKQGDTSAKEAVLQNLDKECFVKCISDMAEAGDDLAKKIVYKNPCATQFRDCIVNMADKGDEKACSLILENFETSCFKQLVQEGHDWVKQGILKQPQVVRYADLIIAWAESGDSYANKVALDSFSLYVTKRTPTSETRNYLYLDYFMKRFNQGDVYAKKIMLRNPKFEPFVPHILQLAKTGDSCAVSTILEQCVEDPLYEDFVVQLAESGNEVARPFVVKKYPEALSLEFIDNLVRENDERIKPFILKNYRKNVKFIEYVIDYANRNDADARRLIFRRLGCREFQDCVIQWLESGDEEAKKAVLRNPRIEKFADYIVDMVNKGSWEARDVVLQNPAIEKLADCVLDMVNAGSSDARDVMLQNPTIEKFAECIVGMANRGESNARAVVLQNLTIEKFAECIVDMANAGSSDARDVVLQNPAIEKFAECIVDMANAGSSDARDVVLQNPAIEKFADCIIDMAKTGDREALEILLQTVEGMQDIYDFRKFLDVLVVLAEGRNEIVRNFILTKIVDPTNIKLLVGKAGENSDFFKHIAFENYTICASCIERWAKSGDGASKEFMLRNANLNVFQLTIIEWAKKGMIEAKQAVLRNPKHYQSIVAIWAKNNDASAIKVVLDNCREEYFKDALFTLADAGNPGAKQKIYLSYKDYEFASKIIAWAENGDSEARDFVYGHTKELVYDLCVKKWSKKNNHK
jgi:ribosomal protein L17